MSKTLSGVIAAIATPIGEDGAPDLKRAVKLARFLLDNGCDGLNVLGTTGEATSFARDEREAVMTAYQAEGLPLDRLMVGTGAAALSDAVALTRHAADLGFAGALVLPPFYYKGVPDDGLIAYIDTLVKATAQRPIPIYLYHFPAQSGLPWHIALVKRLLESYPNRIVGLKDSSGDMAYARAAAAVAPDFAVFPSTEAALIEARARRVRRLHLGHRQSQRRSMRTGLARRRPGCARCGGDDPQIVRRQAAGLRREGAARAYPWRPGAGAGQAAAGAVFGRRPRSGICRLRYGTGQTGGLSVRFAGVDARAGSYYKPRPWRRGVLPPRFFRKDQSLGRSFRRETPVVNERLMANTKSARKATRKIARRTIVNKARRSLLRNSVRKIEEAIASGDRTAALAAFKEAEPAIMRAAQRGVVHKNNASRKVSRLAHRIAKLAK